MRGNDTGKPHPTARYLKLLIFLMFAAFAMTTDSVGTVIPEIIREFHLGMTAAGSFHYATMAGIALSALTLGFLADAMGRKFTILVGLALFCASSALISLGDRFHLFVGLLFLSGIGIGIFKSGALALIGDISLSTRDHARTMNLVEGFFGVGAIAGPAIVAYALSNGASWKWVYAIAAGLCLFLLLGSALAPFPRTAQGSKRGHDAAGAIRMLSDPLALFFAIMLMLYVGAEAAIYVWAPMYFAGYDGANAWLAAYVVSIFFILRAAGRFLGSWLLARLDWSLVLAICSAAMAVLFWAAVAYGRDVALFALPGTGLFMSVLYPTINSTGINCFDRSRHGAIAGFLLFFTCLSAVVAPLAMAAAGDLMGSADISIVIGGLLATGLAILCLWNLLRNPAASRLGERNTLDYSAHEVAAGSLSTPS
jgi:fucose permease